MKFVHFVAPNCSEVSQLGPGHTYLKCPFLGISTRKIISAGVRPWAKTLCARAVRRTGRGQLCTLYRYVSFTRTPIYRNSRYTGHFPWVHSRSMFVDHCIPEIPVFRYAIHRIFPVLYPLYRVQERYSGGNTRVERHTENNRRDCGYMHM